MKVLAVAVGALVVGGCATVPLNTPSGKPETILSRAPANVRDCLTNAMLSSGWRVRSEAGSQLVFSKRADPTLGITAQYGHVVTYALVKESGGTKVITDLQMVLNLDTAAEHHFDQAPQAQARTAVDQAVARCR